MSLCVMRHPRVLLPVPTCYGASEVPVDLAHAQQCAEQLARHLPPHTLVVTSARQRTQAVARLLHGMRPELPAWQVDARLNEMDFGDWEMQPWDAVPRRELDAWSDDFAHYRCGGKESVAQVLARSQAAWQTYRQLAERSGHTLVWITHAGIIKALQYLQSPAANHLPHANEWPTSTVAYGEPFELACGVLSKPDWWRDEQRLKN